MRVWIDISNSPQVPLFRPMVGLLRERGHTVRISTREYAQTLELLRLHGLEHEPVGPRHGGAGAVGKARAMAGRVRALRRYARGREFDVALAHASHELPIVARSLGIPSAYAFDYEFATVQHGLGCRAATRVVVPDAIPQQRLDRLGARARKVRRYPGLKEEYYVHGFEPDASVLDMLGLDRGLPIVVVDAARGLALPPARESALHRGAGASRSRPGRAAVVLPRTSEQREVIHALALPSLVLPDRALDAQSLVALADLVVSAGGTMNREAVALGVPVYTTFAGRLGAVDAALVEEGRLRVHVGR